MNITTRSQAIRGKLGEYFTGLPCKNGHIAKRYTRSGACYLCIHPDIPRPGAEQREERRVARQRMLIRRFRIADAQHSTFMAQALGLAISYEPSMEMADIRTRGKVIRLAKWAGIYAVRIFPEMEQYLRPLELTRWDGDKPGAPPLNLGPDYWPEHDPR